MKQRSLLLHTSFLILFTCFYQGVFSQTIKGVIEDNITKETVPGASVEIKSLHLGTTTNISGYFEFLNVPAGTYVLTIHEIGYNPMDETIDVRGKDVKKLHLDLVSSSTLLNEVTVRSKRNSESDINARLKEKNSIATVNVVSAEAIRKSPDLNVADVVQRVSGITLDKSSSSKDEFVIIRGLNERYSNTLINGIQIPSPDDKNRAIPLDIIPSDLVGNLVVSKTLTPDMEGDAIAGTVDVQMKDAPSEDLFEVNVAAGFNQALINGHYLYFDKSLANPLDPAQRFGHNYKAVQTDFPSGLLKLKTKKFIPDQLEGLTFGKRFLKNKMGVIFSVSNQGLYSGSSGTETVLTQGYDNVQTPTNSITRNLYYYNTHLGLNGKVDYTLNQKNKLIFSAIYLRSTETLAESITDTTLQGAGRTGPGTGLVDSTVRSIYTIQTLANVSLKGIHKLNKVLNLDYTLSYADSRATHPDQVEMQLYKTLPQSKIFLFQPSGVTHTWQRNFDKDYSMYLNLNWNTKVRTTPVDFKFGGLVRRKTRTNYVNTYTLNAFDQGSTTDSYFTPNFNDYTFQVTNPLGFPTINSSNYSADETIGSVYAMTRIYLKNLIITAGVRDENTDQSNHNQNVNAPFNVIYNYFKYNDILPSVNLKYQLTDLQDFRLSYNKSISRPNFYELVAFNDRSGANAQQGNPDLKHSRANNYDLRYEYFPDQDGALFLGLFYKTIYNPIENSLAPGDTPTIKPVNGNTATNYGFEASLIKYVGDFGLSGNYTYTISSTLDTKISYVKLYDSSGNYTGIGNTHPIEKHALQGQSKNIANASLIYRNKRAKINASLSILFQGKRIDAIQQYYHLDYYQQNYTNISFSADKTFGKRFSIFVKLNNLNNPAFLVKSEPGVFIRRDLFGQDYLLGLRYKFL